MMASAKRVSREAYEDLCRLVQHWNENRLELFEISMPNEDLEFEGIMRFYFQNENTAKGSEKVATKCIRVSNSATTDMVIAALVQKFRPDMRMLTNQSYALYEVHANQDERKLENGELPLLVQLGWSRGDRDGRFLLRSEAAQKTPLPTKLDKKAQKKRLSRRGKKSKKDKDKEKERTEIEGSKDEEDGVNGTGGRIARSLYNIMPESRFTRSISIKNRRNLLTRTSPDKLLRNAVDEDISNELKVYADFVLPDVPSKSLLVSGKDTASQVVKSALDKYGIREDSTKFCLVQVTVPSTFDRGSEPHLNVDYNERMLGDNEYPHQVHSDWASGSGTQNSRGTMVQFQLRRRSSFLRNQRDSRSRSRSPEDDPSIPALVEIFQGAQSPPQSPRRFELSLELTEIGSNVALLDPKSYICLTSGGIKPRHCVISSVNGIFTISPLDKTALIFVNGKYIKEPAFLPHNAEVKLGDREMFRFFAPVEHKLFTSSMHTLPSNIGRPNSSRGMTSPIRQERKSSLPRSDNISKAFSVEDICSPGFSSNRMVAIDGRLKDRAFSEHNLKVDDRSSSGYGSGRVQRKFSEPNFMSEDGFGGSRSKHGGSDSHFGTFPSSNKKRHFSAPSQGDKGHHEEGVESEWVLPASLSFYQAQGNLLLQNMISEVNGYLLSFKLAPACSLYMLVKHHLSPEFQHSATPSERRKALSLTIKNIIVQFKKSIKESRNIAGALAFWMSNSSEFLHFINKDYQLSHYSPDFETPLSQVIHTAYKYFTSCMLRELGMFLSAFYDESVEADSEEGYLSGGESATSVSTGKEPEVSVNRSPLSRPTSMTGMYWSVAGSKVRRRGRPTIGDVLTTLSSTVSLLRRCRVNATLSIMIFSLLFRYISTKLFNKLMADGKLCTRAIGQKMKRRLERVREWAEKEGMELPAEDHLCMIVQATSLLQSVKKLPEDAQAVFATCPKLNSLQVHTILHHCSLSDTEHPINQGFAEQLVMLAQAHVDETYRSDGLELNLEEDSNLELPFLVPQRGYSSDSIRGIPQGLHEYLDPMISSGLCKLTIAKDDNPKGMWVPPEREKALSPAYSGSMSNVHITPSPHPMDPSKGPMGSLKNHVPANEVPFQAVVQNRLAAVPTTLQEVVIIHVNIKKEQHSLGISIIGGKNSAMHGDIGIFVKSMVEGGAAHLDGRIQPGDQILAVDNFNLDGCMQEEAAKILRSTGKVVNLTVAKQTAGLSGLSYLISQPSPRYSRKLDRLSEGTSHSRKAVRKQRREQRERFHHERQQQQQREFRLERRKPQADRPSRAQELSHSYPMPASHNHQSTGDSRFPPHSNPQLAKWIMEQNPMYYSDMGPPTGSELDLQSSMSSLANIPERDHPAGSPELSYLESSNRYQYDIGDRSYYRPSTPPVRDSSPPKPAEHRSSSYTNFESMGSSMALDSRPGSEAPSKFSEFTGGEMGSQIPSAPVSRVPTSAGPYKDGFSPISSQMTLESQQMLTPFSQQQTSSQHQQQHLDKLSMDVMQHTQLSGTSFQGITSLIPRISGKQQAGSKTSEPHLDHKGLKEFEMDDIALEKQRIQLMFYEQRKQKEQLELDDIAKAKNAKVDNPSTEDEDECEENHDEPLPTDQLRQELDSLEEMVSAQRKKYREIKFSREREEINLKQIEMKFREQELTSGAFVLNSGDQKRWQTDQKRMLRELERLKNDQNETIQKIQYSERRAKTKLKAYEAQASEIRQQLLGLESSSPTVQSPNTGTKTGFESYDIVPSKLTSDYSKRGPSSSKAHLDMDPAARDSPRERDHSHSSAASELKWNDVPSTKTYNGGLPARATSIESMSTAMFEPPDLAREPLNTISASCLTEPTQDEPRPGNWSGYNSSARNHTDLYSAGSRGALDNDQDEPFGLDRSEQLGHLNESFKAVSMNSIGTSQSNPNAGKVKEIAGYSSDTRTDSRLPAHRGASFNRQKSQPQNSEKKDGPGSGSTSEGRGSPSKAPIYAIPEWNETTNSTYDIPSNARSSHQQTTFMHIQPTGRHYSRNNRSRVQYTKVYLQPTTRYEDSNQPSIESPKRDTHKSNHIQGNTTAAPDVVPTAYTSPLSPLNSNSGALNVRQVTGSERNQSPGGKNSPLAPSPQPVYSVPSDSYYAVPIPHTDRSHPSSNTASPTPHATAAIPGRTVQGTDSLKYRQYHPQSVQQSSNLDGSMSATGSPTMYDQPNQMRNHSAASTRPSVTASKPAAAVYDIPAAARRPTQKTSPYEGVNIRQADMHSNLTTQQTSVNHGPLPNSKPTTKPKPGPSTHGHRYGIGKPGMGHSYSRSRPDPMQQPLGLEKVKGYMDRAYKNQGTRHPPDRIQRQQTEL